MEGLDLKKAYSARDEKDDESKPRAKREEVEEADSTDSISPSQTREHPLSRPHTLNAIQSHRSYGGEDGYSCHQGEPSLEAGYQTDEEKRFEVKWDGDDDSMSPRSMTFARKWLVVLILAASALCVYVDGPNWVR